MTHTEKLAALTAAIQKACPELMDVRLGSKVKIVLRQYSNDPENLICRYAGKSIASEQYVFVDSEGEIRYSHSFEFIGNEIHLEHVLRALAKTGRGIDFAIQTTGCWMNWGYFANQEGEEEWDEIRKKNWDLEKDFSGQSEETIDLLYCVICKE